MSSTTIHVPLGVLDHFCPPNYPAVGWYIPAKDGVTAQEAFAALQDGLRQTFKQLPWLSGKVFKQARSTTGWRPGRLEIRYDALAVDDDSAPLPQLRFKQLDDGAPMTYNDVKELEFPTDNFPDHEVLWGEYINVPGEVKGVECFKAQANFMPGGVFLCGAIHHNVCDGTGQFYVWNLWAANCDALQSGTKPATMPDPLSSDRGVIERIWAAACDGNKNEEKMAAVSWTLLDMVPPDGGIINRLPSSDSCPEEKMQSAIFYMSADRYAALHRQCAQEAGATARISGNDALAALIWRGLLKARRTAALNAGRVSESDLANVQAKLQLTLDGRHAISSLHPMPLIYLGNVVFMNVCVLPLAQLTGPDTSIGSVARHIRQVAEAATGQAMLDSYTLARRLDHLSDLCLSIAPLRDYDMMLSPIMSYPIDEMRWGRQVWAMGGKPDALRPLLDAINIFARLCSPLPRKTGAGTEFVLNLFQDEMDMLLQDEEFGQYAMYLSS